MSWHGGISRNLRGEGWGVGGLSPRGPSRVGLLRGRWQCSVCSDLCQVTIPPRRGLPVTPLMGECLGGHLPPRRVADPCRWEFQLLGGLEHSGGIPSFWIEGRTSHFIVLLRISFKVLRAPQQESFPNVSAAWGTEFLPCRASCGSLSFPRARLSRS